MLILHIFHARFHFKLPNFTVSRRTRCEGCVHKHGPVETLRRGNSNIDSHFLNFRATLSHLPVEILRKIISYLPDYDRISLALTEYSLFDVWVPSLGLVNFIIDWFKSNDLVSSCLDFRTSYNLNMDVVNDYFKNQAPTITQVNFGNCYWVDPDGLAEVVANLHSVEHLQLHGIKLKSTHLLNIFKSCQKITHLTVSFDGFDSTFWKLEPDADEDDRQTFRYNCIFYEWRDRLARLKYLKLHGDSFCHIMFSVLLR